MAKQASLQKPLRGLLLLLPERLLPFLLDCNNVHVKWTMNVFHCLYSIDHGPCLLEDGQSTGHHLLSLLQLCPICFCSAVPLSTLCLLLDLTPQVPRVLLSRYASPRFELQTYSASLGRSPTLFTSSFQCIWLQLYMRNRTVAMEGCIRIPGPFPEFSLLGGINCLLDCRKMCSQ